MHVQQVSWSILLTTVLAFINERARKVNILNMLAQVSSVLAMFSTNWTLKDLVLTSFGCYVLIKWHGPSWNKSLSRRFQSLFLILPNYCWLNRKLSGQLFQSMSSRNTGVKPRENFTNNKTNLLYWHWHRVSSWHCDIYWCDTQERV